MFCTSCGKQIEENSKFCIYCGSQIFLPADDKAQQISESVDQAPVTHTDKLEDGVESSQPADKKFTVEQDRSPKSESPVQTTQKTEIKPKEPIDLTKYDNVFWIIYVLTGAAGLFTDGMMIPSAIMFANGFTVFLGVVAMLLAVANTVIAILRFINSLKATPEDRAANKTRDIIWFAISIMLFIFLMVSCIMCFGVVARVNA